MTTAMAVDISEVELARSRRRLDFYLVLFFIVGPVWFIVPAAWAFVIHATATASFYSYGWKGRSLYAIAFFEVLFSIYYSYLTRLHAHPTTTPIRSIEELELTFDRILKAGLANLSADNVFDEETLDDSRPGSPEEKIVQLEHDDHRAIDFRNAFRTWFHGAPWSAVRKHEVRQWLHWALFNSDMPEDLETLDPEDRAALERAVHNMEKRIGKVIPEGRGTTPVRLSVDKLNVYARPFIVYAALYFMNFMAKVRLQRKYHLRFSAFNGLEYCMNVPDSWDPDSDTRPIVFFHGIGVGISQYKIALSRIARNFNDRPLLVVLQPHVSQNIFHHNFLTPMSREQTTERLAALLHQLGWANADREIWKEASKECLGAQKGVTMLSHSNGTYGHGWMLKDYPHMITRSCFVDPVTFCAWEGDLCYNFLYKRCINGLDLIIRYFVSTELGVANLMQRRFDWSSNALWYEEIPNARDASKTLFILGGKDTIVKAHRVRDYLTSHGIRNSLYWDESGHHGQPFILNGESHKRMLTWLRQA